MSDNTAGYVTSDVGPCWKCGGTGTYAWGGSTNGKARFTGMCYRCRGTGTITVADERRNYMHDAYCTCWRHV